MHRRARPVRRRKRGGGSEDKNLTGELSRALLERGSRRPCVAELGRGLSEGEFLGFLL